MEPTYKQLGSIQFIAETDEMNGYAHGDVSAVMADEDLFDYLASYGPDRLVLELAKLQHHVLNAMEEYYTRQDALKKLRHTVNTVTGVVTLFGFNVPAKIDLNAPIFTVEDMVPDLIRRVEMWKAKYVDNILGAPNATEFKWDVYGAVDGKLILLQGCTVSLINNVFCYGKLIYVKTEESVQYNSRDKGDGVHVTLMLFGYPVQAQLHAKLSIDLFADIPVVRQGMRAWAAQTTTQATESLVPSLYKRDVYGVMRDGSRVVFFGCFVLPQEDNRFTISYDLCRIDDQFEELDQIGSYHPPAFPNFDIKLQPGMIVPMTLREHSFIITAESVAVAEYFNSWRDAYDNMGQVFEGGKTIDLHTWVRRHEREMEAVCTRGRVIFGGVLPSKPIHENGQIAYRFTFNSISWLFKERVAGGKPVVPDVHGSFEAAQQDYAERQMAANPVIDMNSK